MHVSKSSLAGLFWLAVAASAGAQQTGISSPDQTAAYYQERLTRAAADFRISTGRCQEARRRGAIKTHLQFASCINQGMDVAYQRAGYLYPDLAAALDAKRLEMAQKMDARHISEMQGAAEFLEFSRHISAEEAAREKQRAQKGLPAQP